VWITVATDRLHGCDNSMRDLDDQSIAAAVAAPDDEVRLEKYSKISSSLQQTLDG
jgi:hypothetical protein